MNCAKLLSKCRAFHREDDGPTTVEYAVMLAMIIGVCIIAVELLSQKTKESFNNSAAAIDAVL